MILVGLRQMEETVSKMRTKIMNSNHSDKDNERKKHAKALTAGTMLEKQR